MKTPYQRSYDSYHSVEQEESWNDFLSHHLNNEASYVHSTPDYFVVAEGLGITLHIHEFAGNMTKGLSKIPSDFQHISYQRRDGVMRLRKL